MKHEKMVEGLRQMARRKFRDDAKELEAALREIDEIANGPTAEEARQTANEVIGELERQRRKDNWLFWALVAVGIMLVTLQGYRYFARAGFGVGSVISLFGAAIVMAVLWWFRARFGKSSFWIAFVILAAAAVLWAVLH